MSESECKPIKTCQKIWYYLFDVRTRIFIVVWFYGNQFFLFCFQKHTKRLGYNCNVDVIIYVTMAVAIFSLNTDTSEICSKVRNYILSKVRISIIKRVELPLSNHISKYTLRVDIGYLQQATESSIAILWILSIIINFCYSIKKCQNQAIVPYQ